MKKIILIILLYLSPLLWSAVIVMLSAVEAPAQDQHLIDSLQLQLKNLSSKKLELGKNTPVLNDSTAANILAALSFAYWFVDYEKATDYAQQCWKLSEQIGYKKGIGKAYNALGVINIYQGNNLPALEFLNKALKIKKESGDQKEIAKAVNNIGAVYYTMCLYPEALKYYLAALKINERIENKTEQQYNLSNIGQVNMDMGNFAEATKYYLLALNIAEKVGNNFLIASTRINIADMYNRKGDFDSALQQIELALKLNKEGGSPGTEAIALIQIGKAYYNQGKYQDALKTLFKSLKISEQLGEKSGVADSYNLIGAVYIKQKSYNDAAENLQKGLLASKEISNSEKIKDCYKSLAALDSSQGNYAKALEYYKLSIAYRDSIQNTEIANKTAALQLQYDTEKKEKQITLLTKESKLQQAELQKQNTSRNVLIVACALIALLAGIIFNRYHIKQKANAEIEGTLHHLKTTQKQLIEHEKLASLGKFTAEVAREIEVPVKQINQLSKLNSMLILNIKNNNSMVDADALKNNLLHIFNYGKEADAVVKKVLTETRKIQG